MTVSATFEVATLSDAVTKASSFAPRKGGAVDRSGGILFDIDPDEGTCRVSATDLESAYSQTIRLVDFECVNSFKWRISERILEPILKAIPADPGSTIAIEDDGAGKVKLDAKGFVDTHIWLLSDPDGFPEISQIEGELSEIEMFGLKLDKVAWAASRKNDIMSGVHLTGSHAVATNGTTAAIVPLEVKLDEAATVPFGSALSLLKAYPVLGIGATSKALRVKTDSDTEITMNLMSGKYPDVLRIVESTSFPHSTKVPRIPLIELINRLSAPFSDRLLRAKLTIESSVLSMVVEEQEVGRLGGFVELEAQADDIEMLVTLADFKSILSNASGQNVKFSYIDSLKQVKISDDDGFAAITMPRKG